MSAQSEFSFWDSREAKLTCPRCKGTGQISRDQIKFEGPVAGADDLETSWEAAHDAEFHASESRIAALKALYRLGPMTDYELAKATGYQQNSIGKRRLDCQRAGLIEMLVSQGQKIRRLAPSGSSCFVWKLTGTGEEYVRGLP